MRFLLAVPIIFLLTACDRGVDSPRGFSLPDGDIERGETVFLSYDCLACHQLADYEAEFDADELEEPVSLGGKVTRVKTYAELVTSIINPSHRIASGYSADELTDEAGDSKMRNYNDIMTVTDLIDLVAFLQSHYELTGYPETHYVRYYP